MKLTLDQFVAQWAPGGNSRRMVSRFEGNIFEFTTIAGYYSKRFFHTSFMVGGFYGSGKSWEPRQSRWGKKKTHKVLIETGTLMKSIKYEGNSTNRTGWTDSRKRIFTRGARYDIWTTEKSKRKGKNRNGTYAAVHNTDPRYSNFTVNQYSKKKPVQRQFIGFSPALDRDIEKFLHIIFRGFPNA